MFRFLKRGRVAFSLLLCMSFIGSTPKEVVIDAIVLGIYPNSEDTFKVCFRLKKSNSRIEMNDSIFYVDDIEYGQNWRGGFFSITELLGDHYLDIGDTCAFLIKNKIVRQQMVLQPCDRENISFDSPMCDTNYYPVYELTGKRTFYYFRPPNDPSLPTAD